MLHTAHTEAERLGAVSDRIRVGARGRRLLLPLPLSHKLMHVRKFPLHLLLFVSLQFHDVHVASLARARHRSGGERNERGRASIGG